MALPKLTEVFVVHEASGHVRGIKASRMPKEALRKMEDVYLEFFRRSIQKYRSSGLPQDVAAQFIRARKLAIQELNRDGIEKLLNDDDSWIWYSDGTTVAGIWFDVRITFLSKGVPVAKQLEDGELALWDGHEWRSDFEHIFGPGKALTPEDRATAEAMITAAQNGKEFVNPRTQHPQMQNFFKKTKQEYETGSDEKDRGGGKGNN